MRRVIFSLLMIIPSILLAQVSLTRIPVNYQFYPRDKQDSSVVPVAGAVTAVGIDSVSLTVYKAGSAYRRLSQALAYSGNSAPFAFSPKIHAELTNYKFELRIGTTLVKSVDRVVCGDAFMVDGQSNAAYSETWQPNQWLRSFTTDSTWVEAAGFPWDIGYHIITDLKMPVCIINGSVSATNIDAHQRDTVKGSIYGNIYWRITRAGLRNNIRAVIWYLGEGATNDSLSASSGYDSLFRRVFNAWHTDYPGIEHTYLFQVHTGYCSGDFCHVLRETQRQLPSKLPNLSIMATAGVQGHDGCHYSSAGYRQMGDWMYRLILRDLYGSTDTAAITPPNIQAAWFDASHTQLTMLFDQAVVLPSDSSIKDYFYLDGAGNQAISASTDAAQHTLTLILKGQSQAKSVRYIPSGYYPGTQNVYEGPWLANSRGVGALTFNNIPIPADSALFVDTLLLDFYANSSGMIPADPTIHLANSAGKPVGPLSATPDSSWLQVTIQGAGNAQSMHHSVNLAALGTSKSKTTRVKLSAAGFSDLFYTVIVKNGSPIPTALRIVPENQRIFQGNSCQYSALILDEYREAFTSNLPIDWSVSGLGTIDNNGLFKSSGAQGDFTLTARIRDFPSITDAAAGSVVGYLPGVQYEYFAPFTATSVDSIKSNILVKKDTTNNFNYGVAQQVNNYALRFTGFLSIPSDGDYTFYTSSDDGSKLLIDGNVIVNNDNVHGPGEKTGTITLQKGLVPITVLFFQAGGGTALTVSWQGPGITKQSIPDSVLFYTPESNIPVQAAGRVPRLTASSAVLMTFTNPSKGEMRILISIPISQEVSLRIFDTKGRVARTLAHGRLAAGYHTFTFNGPGDNNHALAYGTYFCMMQLEAPNECVKIKKLVLER